MTHRFKEAWQERIAKDLVGFQELIDWDPFDDWIPGAMPEAIAEQEFRNGLLLLLGGQPELSRIFLLRASAVVEKAEEEGIPKTEEQGFPRNRGELLRVRTYTKGLLDTNHELDRGSLLQASSDYEDWCSTYSRNQWDSQAQAYFLAAVRLALLGGEIDRTGQLLDRRKTNKWHPEEDSALRRLVHAGPDARRDSDLQREFTILFDQVRDPYYTPNIFLELDFLRIELALLRLLYLESFSRPIDWKDVIESIRR